MIIKIIFLRVKVFTDIQYIIQCLLFFSNISFFCDSLRSLLSGWAIIVLSVKKRPKLKRHLSFLYLLHDFECRWIWYVLTNSKSELSVSGFVNLPLRNHQTNLYVHLYFLKKVWSIYKPYERINMWASTYLQFHPNSIAFWFT